MSRIPSLCPSGQSRLSIMYMRVVSSQLARNIATPLRGVSIASSPMHPLQHLQPRHKGTDVTSWRNADVPSRSGRSLELGTLLIETKAKDQLGGSVPRFMIGSGQHVKVSKRLRSCTMPVAQARSNPRCTRSAVMTISIATVVAPTCDTYTIVCILSEQQYYR